MDEEVERFLTEEQLRPDPALVAEGWNRRFIANFMRAAEAIELYEKLGFEVRAEPVKPREAGAECEDCTVAIALQFSSIYTRKKSR